MTKLDKYKDLIKDIDKVKQYKINIERAIEYIETFINEHNEPPTIIIGTTCHKLIFNNDIISTKLVLSLYKKKLKKHKTKLRQLNNKLK